MNQNERLQYLIRELSLENQIEISLPQSLEELFSLYRALVNMRMAGPISQTYIDIENAMLQEMNEQKGIVEFNSDQRIIVWKGDITRLKVDAIVNAANDQMEGCFIPGHHCIDNAIHTFAGVQLRNECHEMISRQGYLEPVGKAKITSAYNLPCQYVIHTVGPMIHGILTSQDQYLLSSCYESCLRLAEQKQLHSIAFCCISTGVFHFPQRRAAEIAIKTVQDYLPHSKIGQVIFNVFKDTDEYIYQQILSKEK